MTDLEKLLAEQIEFSEKTYGPGARTKGVLDHIRKELKEIEEDPLDLEEWIDVVILAFDGAWRSGHTAEQVVEKLLAKYAKNRARSWPDWRTADPDKAIEHERKRKKPEIMPARHFCTCGHPGAGCYCR